MINFGLMYGMSAFGLAQRLNIARAEAREIIEPLLRAVPEDPAVHGRYGAVRRP